ncbi:SET and MYND domain-containing protein 4 [Eurytemora carolleeae]|uniref:SET and MYND domain-containing protein 4 n=1 Tax=Eurytemora carolleeae TaxID=1294199 RepID=UPI000C775312|nr:SET and MYND domain-containing protein 4 [Eurytemora carolleeae]|eukprot:XP_023322924.1 SET and MYND domain-containing protein 4-like [Eurytemora affinis]
MAFLSEEMKAQLMKVVGVSKDEFNVLLEKHSPEISKCEENLVRSSPFDIQQILFKNIIETEGLNELNELKTIEDKVEWIYSRLMMDQDFRNIRNLLPERKEFKDSIKSKELKEKGNHEFQRKNYQEAIRFYNQSFISASSDKEIALSLANRSVVFFNLKEYSNCIQDCKAALLFGYPQELVYKVHERTARCCVQIGQTKEAKENILQAKLTLNKAKLSEERRETVEADLETLLKGLPAEAADHTLTNGAVKVEIKDDSHLKLLSRNKKFPNLSRSVDIKFNPEAGRHAVANSKIQPGEVILEEIPLTWTINPNQTLRTCIRCLKQTGKHMVPSKQRENLFYCSLVCYNRATESADLNLEKMQADDHRLVDLFCSANESSATTMLAFWAIRSQPLDFFVTNESALFEGISPEFGINTPEGWKLEGKEQIYKNLYNLVSHTDSLPEETLLDILITSTVLLRSLS